MTSVRRQFELLWPRVQGGEAIFEQSPHILHVRLTSAQCDENLLLVQMDVFPTPGFAHRERPAASCACPWAEVRCSDHGLCSFTWSLHVASELIEAIVERAALTATERWTREQYRELSNVLTDWELDNPSKPLETENAKESRGRSS